MTHPMSPGEVDNLAEETRQRGDVRKAVEEEIKVRRSDAPVASNQPPRPGSGGRIIPSSLGTDLTRFQSTARRNRYEEDQMRLVLATALKSDGNAVDVGAHGGSVLREIVRLAPRGKHLAFEPLPVQARRLAHLFPAVDIREVALSDRDGEASFVHVKTLSPWSGLLRRPYPSEVDESDLEEITVRVERLDTSLPEGYVPDIIKVDVEGAEEWVLRGALNTLRNYDPLVIFEHSVSGCSNYGTTSASLYNLICHDAGFRIFDLGGDGPYTASEFEESQRQLRWVNYLARQ